MLRKRLVVGLSIVLVMASACTSKVPKETQPKVTDTNKQSRQASIPVTKENTLIKIKSPKAFRPIDWLGTDLVIGFQGEQIVTLDLSTSKQTKLPISGWNASLSPDKNQLAYDDSKGIWIYDLNSHKSKLLWSRNRLAGEGEEGELAYMWGTDASKLLISHVYEWDGEHFVVDVPTGKEQALKTELKNYFLTFPVGWLNHDTILFETRASVSLAGDKQYSFGYRGDLGVLKLADNKLQLITKAKDGEFFAYSGIDSGEITALVSREQESPSMVRLDSQGQILESKNISKNVRFIINREKREPVMVEQDQTDSQLVSSFTVKTLSGQVLGKLEAEAVIGILEDSRSGRSLLATMEDSQGESIGIWLIN